MAGPSAPRPVRRWTFQAGVSASAALPTAPSPGSVVIYAVAPALPDGLTLNATTAVISGAATAASPSTDYTLTASDQTRGWLGGPLQTDTATLPFTLQVTGSRPTVSSVSFLTAPARGGHLRPGRGRSASR